MTKHTHPHPHRLAGTAIAAFLALSSTSIWAQEAPVDATTAQAAPTIVLPPIVTQPAPEPVAESAAGIVAAPTPRAADPRAAAPRASASPKLAATPANRAAPLEAAPISAASRAPVAEIAPVADANALPADLATAPGGAQAATTNQSAPNGSSNELLFAGLAGALGLGAIGLFAANRRRRPLDTDETVAAYEPVAEPAEVAPQRYATLVSPAFTPLPAWSEPRTPLAQQSDSRALNLNRSALIDRMVAAQPDTNNPFTSAKGRRHRARLMLQSMDSQRWDDAELVPGFDWREMAQAVEKRETTDA
jgi:hypothetical protein